MSGEWRKRMHLDRVIAVELDSSGTEKFRVPRHLQMLLRDAYPKLPDVHTSPRTR